VTEGWSFLAALLEPFLLLGKFLVCVFEGLGTGAVDVVIRKISS